MAEDDDVSGSPGGNAGGSAEGSAGDDATTPEETRPVLPPDPASATPHATPHPVLVTRWRDRAWSFRAMLAVALATLVIGGIAGGTVVALADDDDEHGHFWMGPGGPDDGMPPGWGPRHYRDGGPKWRWDDGTPDGPDMMPYGGQPTAPSPLTPSPSSGSTG